MQVFKNNWFLSLCVAILIVANIFVYCAIFAQHILTVKDLEVGPADKRGSAILVRSVSGATILIDAGPDASILRALGTTLPPWQRKIDAVILTSTKRSATGGLQDVLNHYKILRQITITRNQRLSIGGDTYIDIVISPNAPASIYISDGKTATKIK